MLNIEKIEDFKPGDVEDVLKITLGTLRDTHLTSDQYLEWKRAEIGAEN